MPTPALHNGSSNAPWGTRLLGWLALPVLTLLAVATIIQYDQRRSELLANLVQLLETRAANLDLVTGPAVDQARDLASLLETQWTDPPRPMLEYRESIRPRFLESGKADGYTSDPFRAEMRNRFGYFFWTSPTGEPPPGDWVSRSASFLEYARVALERSPNSKYAYFRGESGQVEFGHPWLSSTEALKTWGISSLEELRGVVQELASRRVEFMSANPGVNSFWTQPFQDSATQATYAVYSRNVLGQDGAFLGRLSIGVNISALVSLVEKWRTSSIGHHYVVAERTALGSGMSPVVLVDSNTRYHPAVGQTRISSATDVHNALEDQKLRLRLDIASRLPPGVNIEAVARSLQRPGTLVSEGGWILGSARGGSESWTYLLIVRHAEVQRETIASLVPNALLAALLVAVFVAGQYALARFVVVPSSRAMQYMNELSRNPGAQKPVVPVAWKGWVDTIAATFAAQRAAQRRVHYREALCAAIMDCSHTAIVAIDEVGHLIEFNSAASRLFGVSRARALGTPLNLYISPLGDAVDLARLEQSRNGRKVQLSGRSQSGREFPVEVAFWLARTEDCVFVAVSIVDLTETIESAREIDRQREVIRQSEKLGAMGGLLASVAHELNNPLAIVVGRSALIEEKADRASLREELAKIRIAAERCGRIVKTFLALARHKPAERMRTQLNEVARAALEIVSYGFRTHSIRAVCDLDPNLPEVEAEPDRIGQAILNLLVNAQYAVGSLVGPREVCLRSGIGDGYIWIRVTDNGTGVPADLAPRIFEPYFTTKPEGAGTGIGLSTSRAIALEHGGDLILLPRRFEGGAEFEFRVPYAGTADSVDESSASMQERSMLGSAIPLRVLVVDDEIDVALTVVAMLADEANVDCTATDGLAVLDHLARVNFDAVICDIRMPGVDGISIWRSLASLPDPPVFIFMTGDSLSEELTRTLSSSGCAVLSKPFSKVELLRSLGQVAELRGRRGATLAPGNEAH
ncbi:hybrid sensor histidine kinase/response regulator [Aquabacterium humicola]|uniref:hybrid sensor histidine kinase/response regulator n=1 Tax=Aquabacterium humicola TaxID=3237377 RepID=UPI002542EAC2|nr:ATP-binding protein [Rubrivivax pictus]